MVPLSLLRVCAASVNACCKTDADAIFNFHLFFVKVKSLFGFLFVKQVIMQVLHKSEVA